MAAVVGHALQSELVLPSLIRFIKGIIASRESAIIEGVHLTPEVLAQISAEINTMMMMMMVPTPTIKEEEEDKHYHYRRCCCCNGSDETGEKRRRTTKKQTRRKMRDETKKSNYNNTTNMSINYCCCCCCRSFRPKISTCGMEASEIEDAADE